MLRAMSHYGTVWHLVGKQVAETISDGAGALCGHKPPYGWVWVRQPGEPLLAGDICRRCEKV